MKKILLLSGLLSSFTAFGGALPYYSYSGKVTLDDVVVSQFNGSLSPTDKHTNSSVTVDGVEKKLKYDPVTTTIGGNGKTTESLIMYVTESNDFVLSVFVKGCGDFNYSSKSIPVTENLMLTSKMNCSFELAFTKVK